MIIQEIQQRIQAEQEAQKQEQNIKAASVMQDGITAELQARTALLSQQNRNNNGSQRAS